MLCRNVDKDFLAVEKKRFSNSSEGVGSGRLVWFYVVRIHYSLLQFSILPISGCLGLADAGRLLEFAAASRPCCQGVETSMLGISYAAL